MDICVWLLYATTFWGVAEGFNCIYPQLEDDYDSEGLVCQWKEDDFDLIDGEYILAPEDSTDNRFEAKARKRYWENK
jgi:nitrite reductase/ring-hydroxylating ferredoxin subunit